MYTQTSDVETDWKLTKYANLDALNLTVSNQRTYVNTEFKLIAQIVDDKERYI